MTRLDDSDRGDAPRAPGSIGATAAAAATTDSPARQAARALGAIDALGLELERIAQAASERPSRSPLALLSWLDRTIAELGWELRALERACALRAREARTRTTIESLAQGEDGGLAAAVAMLKPALVIDGVSGMFAGWLEDVRLRDDHYSITDPFVAAPAAPALLSRRIAEVVADLEPVRAGFEALGRIASGAGGPAAGTDSASPAQDPDEIARRADAVLDFVARRARQRLALRAGWVGLVVRRHLETLRQAREGR